MEILSPAGNKNLVNTAVTSKSNAVYGGFKNWNARNSAINFSKDEYNYSVELLHKNNIKFYLTLNNLSLDIEIEEIINYLKQDDLIKPDAFIVADLGLIQALKENFPNIELHVSTQFGAHNIDDLKLLEELGVKRAILAREVTKEELMYLRENTGLELEVFVWGSQCLSFSGLCFFGSLINGGTGNRGKCINLCRDCYSSSKYDNGTLLYVSDMNCINLLEELKNIDSLKIEGRRRPPKEIENVIKEIKMRKTEGINAGFLYGENNTQNRMINNINFRIAPLYKACEMKKKNYYDVFAKFIDGKPIEFCKEINSVDNDNKDIYYIYSELLNDYKIDKKNYTMELEFDENGIMINSSITNYKGENTLIGYKKMNDKENDDKFDIFEAKEFKEKIMSVLEEDINLIKIKFKKPINKELKISEEILKEILNYFKKQTNIKKLEKVNNNFAGINDLYIQTDDLNIVDNFINDQDVKIIYEISSVKELKNIEKITKKYSDRIIYRLPIFNWKSENLKEHYKKLEDKEVMFTRYSQILQFEDINLKKRYTDYLVYSWNKKVLKFLKEHNIEEFTATPELSVEQNNDIFENENVQYIVAGRPTLVYTRNCLKSILGCKECNKDNINQKEILNNSKNLNFTISCKPEHREMYYKEPVLNDYSKFELNKNIKFRFITKGFLVEDIKEFILSVKQEDYYNKLIQKEIWKNSYECNLLDGRN